MNLNWRPIAIGAGLLTVTAVAVAVVLNRSGDTQSRPAPTATGPSVTITAPVPAPTPHTEDQPTGGVAHDDDDAPEDIESVWTFAPDAGERDVHDEEELDTTSWLPAVEGFVAAFHDVGVDDEAWFAGLKPFIDARLHDAYALPGVRENVYVSDLYDFELLMGGQTAARVGVRFADSKANLLLDLGLGDTASGWAVSRVSPWIE